MGDLGLFPCTASTNVSDCILSILCLLYIFTSSFFSCFSWFYQIAFYSIFPLASSQYFSTPLNCYVFYSLLIITYFSFTIWKQNTTFTNMKHCFLIDNSLFFFCVSPASIECDVRILLLPSCALPSLIPRFLSDNLAL